MTVNGLPRHFLNSIHKSVCVTPGVWMLRFLFYLIGATLFVSLSLAGDARAATDGWATTDVNMRSCASIKCSRIFVIPAGARVSVYYCNSWCRVRYGSWGGYVYGRYISLAPYYRPVYPRLYEVLPPFIYVPPPDYRAPIYGPPRVYRPHRIYRPRIYRPPVYRPPRVQRPPVYRPPRVHRPPPVYRPHSSRIMQAPVRPRAHDRFRPRRISPQPESGWAHPRR
jgi:uncharacterized protein YraI